MLFYHMFPHVIYSQRHSSRLLLLSVLLLCISAGHSLVVKSSVGEDAVLPCEVDPTTDPKIDLVDLPIFWIGPGERYLYIQRNGGELVDSKDPSYVGRTSLFQDEVKKGNMSLKLTRVKPSDEGIYTCFILPNILFTVQLIVAPHQVSAVEGGEVILPCKTNFTVPLTDITVNWTREDLTPHHVHVIMNGQEKNSFYKARTSVSVEDGDVSLRISRVKFSDEGLYTCYITSEKECVVNLTVESSPVGHKPWLLITVLTTTPLIIVSVLLLYKRCRHRTLSGIV